MNDPVYGALADDEAALPKFLSNDLGGGFRIEETVPQGLADHLLGAAVVGLGASFQAQQRPASVLVEEGSELVVTLAAVAEFGGRLVGSVGAALSLYEHGQFAGDFIFFSNRERAEFTADKVSGKLKREHGEAPQKMPNVVYLNMAQIS